MQFSSNVLCKENGNSQDKGNDMNFKSVETGDHSKNSCTPDIPEKATGIWINTPPKVQLEREQLVVCGTYRYPAEYIYKFSSIHRAIVLVAVDTIRHTPYACNISVPSRKPGPRRPTRPHKDPDWMTNHYVQKYFNIDLWRFMTDLPKTDASYYIYALIENNISNVSQVSVQT